MAGTECLRVLTLSPTCPCPSSAGVRQLPCFVPSLVASRWPHAAQLAEANSQREEMVGLLGGYQRSIQELQVGLLSLTRFVENRPKLPAMRVALLARGC